ncbi:thioredoxin H-type-like isoform X1 [Coffea arabica]|uniref:Thioredoxin H-type-like isoform X1 n=1 Tax=Coffea arabica TaxID=13443 RepID=A0A6P6VZY4_COFAR|nr:thioredoxin H-type-like isoform X1 [Coffea arabica]XP_027108663.1 thioredoxin H-type-like isoform X1 [Coffea arabica]
MGLCWTKLNTGNDAHSQLPTAELAYRNVHLVTTVDKWEEKLSEANRDGKIVVVNFSASWSNPCRSIAPAYNELADKYPFMLFLTVDVDELAELSNSWEIKATPTIFFLREGKMVDKLVGDNKQDLQKKTMAIAESCSDLTTP